MSIILFKGLSSVIKMNATQSNLVVLKCPPSMQLYFNSPSIYYRILIFFCGNVIWLGTSWVVSCCDLIKEP